MKFNRLIFLISLFNLFNNTAITQAATHKSIVNKYAFSDNYIDTLNRIILSHQPHFYSLPNSVFLQNSPAVSFFYDNHKLSADLYSVISYEYREHEHLPNGFLGSIIAYNSPHIRGEFQFDLHTNKIHKPTDFADSLNDVAFEQVKSSYDHIAGTGENKDFNFQTGYIEISYDNISLLSGKYPLRWGPGYKGALGLSAATFSPFYCYILQLDLAKRIHASSFLSCFDDVYMFVKDSVSNAERFGAGQRVDVLIGDHVQIGLYEFVNFNGSALLARYANPVQLYYLSTHLGAGVSEKRNNLMGGADLNLVFGPLRIYADFLNDDLTPFDDNGSPNKFGFQIGSAFYGRNTLREAGFEYTHVSRWTYGHWAPGLNRHTYFGESRGWPWGNDQDLWHLHTLLNLPFNIRAYFEVNWWIKGEGTLKEYHWDIPDSLRPDLDNKGGMVDYRQGRHLVSFQLKASWKPLEQVNCEAMWLPVIAKREFENRAMICVTLTAPPLSRKKQQSQPAVE